ncbi:MAG: cytochrome c bioproteinis factor [Bacteroidetes bacterium]|nr:MAG: cytochrome c bioproteinis factor [Bacteroidota bacterium]
MMRLLTPQRIMIAAGVLCIVLLSFAKTTPNAAAVKPGMKGKTAQQGHVHHIDEQVAASRKHLKPEMAKTVAFYEALIASERDAVKRSQAYDSLSILLGRNNEPVLGAWYAEQKAEKNNGSGTDWQKAGERWYAATHFVTSEEDQPVLFEAAVKCFSKALELEPKNLDAKTGLGVCFVEATSEPMKGITLLKEVLEADPENVDALLNLGLFAERSQQYDKAIDRYETILRLHPEYIMMWLKMAEVYQAMGDKAGTIRCLESYLKVETDPVMRNSIENDLNKLKKQ